MEERKIKCKEPTFKNWLIYWWKQARQMVYAHLDSYSREFPIRFKEPLVEIQYISEGVIENYKVKEISEGQCILEDGSTIPLTDLTMNEFYELIKNMKDD